MQTIGFRDFTIRQLFTVLRGGKVCLEKKLEDNMTGVKTDPIKLADDVKLFEKTNPHLPLITGRAFYLSAISHIIRNKKEYSFSTLEFIVDRLNSDLPIEVVGKENTLVKEEELNKLRSNIEEICSSSRTLMDFYFLQVLFNLQLIECCTYMEVHKININFMKELEKGIYEDRKLAYILNLYRNYYKNSSSMKKPPHPTVYDEIQLTYALKDSLHNLKIGMLASLSFEKKPYLQNKRVDESSFLSQYVKTLTEQSEVIFETMTRLLKVKLDREEQPLNNLLDDEKDTRILFLNCFTIINNRIKGHLEIGNKNEEEMKAKNPKYKGKTTESFRLLLDCISTLTPENNKGITDYINKVYELSLEVLKPAEGELKKPKIPKGTRDYTPLQMAIKTKAIDKIKNVFLKHGAVEIDTPVFERRETLLGKFGEEAGKLIYNLEDQGGELLSLRYDLTVPFARYMGLNKLSKLKRFHIGKVYRRDQPNMNKGRFREFYQCDFDIAGTSQGMLADAEVLKIMHEILNAFDIEFKIKISNRLLLEAMIECSGCNMNKFNIICSSVDKLDKESWENVEKELINEKGLTKEQTTKLKAFVLNSGETGMMIQKLEESGVFGDNKKAKDSLNDMKKLLKYLEIFNINSSIVFDLSLARGLDYYTGLIYEAVLVGDSELGSIGGGGRYDGLIGMFSKKSIPSVGMSIGIERLFVILNKKYMKTTRPCETEVFVASIGKELAEHRMRLVNECWSEGLKAESAYEENPKTDKQLKYVLENQIPFIIWVGGDEIAAGEVRVKCTYLSTEEVVKRDKLKEYLQEKVKQYYTDLEKGAVIFKK